MITIEGSALAHTCFGGVQQACLDDLIFVDGAKDIANENSVGNICLKTDSEIEIKIMRKPGTLLPQFVDR